MTRILLLLVAFVISAPSNGSPGTGFAIVTIDDVANTMRVEVSFANLTSTNTASHIHVINGPGDANLLDTLGPVVTTTPTFTGFPSGTTAGVFDATFDMTSASSYRAGFITSAGGTVADAEAALFRGNSRRQGLPEHSHNPVPWRRDSRLLQPAAVPEPASVVLLGSGLVAAAARRRRQLRARAKSISHFEAAPYTPSR